MSCKQVVGLILILALAASLEVKLTREEEDGALLYTLPIDINNQSFNLKLGFSSDVSWVKSQDCSLCNNGSCKDKYQGKLGRSDGFKCPNKRQKSCDKLNSSFRGGRVESGYTLQASISVDDKSFDRQFAVAVKVSINDTQFLRKYDGQLNLLQDSEGYLFDHFALVKNHPKHPLLLVDEPTEKYLAESAQKISLQINDNFQLEVEGVELGDADKETKHRAVLSLNTTDILFPKAIYRDIVGEITKVYQGGCELQKSSIECSGKEKNNIAALEDLILRIKFKDHQLSLPFQSLIRKQNKKELLLYINQTAGNFIILGDVILDNVALNFDMPKKTLDLLRLNNNYNTKLQGLQKQMVKKNTNVQKVQEDHGQKHTTSIRKRKNIGNKPTTEEREKEEETLGQWIIGWLEFLIFFIFKLLLFLAIIAVFVNIFYSRHKLMRWMEKMKFSSDVARLIGQEKDGGYSAALPEEELDTAPSVAQGYDIKNANKEFWEENSVEGI